MQATGAPTTLAGTPKLRVYKAGGTTESSDITPTVDFDSRTGLNLCSIDLTGDSGFYATGNDYSVVITAGTVNSVSVVGYVVADFSILKRSALRPTVAARTLDVSAGGEAGVDWANVGSPTTAVDLSGTNIKTDQKVDVNTIKTNPVVNAGTITFPTTATLASTTNLTAGTIATVSGNVNGSVGSVTGAVGSVTGAVGSVTGNVGGNVTGSVGSVATGGIAAASFAAAAIDAAAIATDAIGSAELAAGAVTKIQTAILSDANPFAGASIAAIKAKTDNLPEGIKKNTASTNFEFLMVDSADHVTGKTGLTVAGAVSIDGGAFGALTNTPATEVANGIYKIDLAAADVNGTWITLKFTAVGADARFVHFKTTL